MELLATTLFQAHALFYTLPEGTASDPSLPCGLLFSTLENITSQQQAGKHLVSQNEYSLILFRLGFNSQWINLSFCFTILLGKGMTILKEDSKLSSWFKYLPPSVTEFQPTLRTLAHPISQDYLRDTLQKWINVWVGRERLSLAVLWFSDHTAFFCESCLKKVAVENFALNTFQRL